MKERPVTLGDPIPLKRQRRGKPVELANSKYLRKQKTTEKNPWREVEISEANLIAALSFLPVRICATNERIERVIVGEPANGVYPLSVAIRRKDEDKD